MLNTYFIINNIPNIINIMPQNVPLKISILICNDFNLFTNILILQNQAHKILNFKF